MHNDVESMVNQLASDLHEFLCFSYELRKQDDPDDKYTNFYLNNLKLKELPFQETLIYQIIMSNYWCEKENCMKVKQDVMYKLFTGRQFEYHLRCEVTPNKQE